MAQFNPRQLYWLADDGRIYSGPAQAIVPNTDQGYVDYINAGFHPAIWPRDAAGNQTNASLQEVLTPYNMWVDLIAYTATARYNRASGGVVVTSLSPVSFLSDPVSRNTVNSAYDYALTNTGTIVNWKMSDGSFITLNNTQITLVMNSMADFVHKCFTCESNTDDSIRGGTITTTAQVDAAFAAIPNVYP